jgi:hypothetical protein
MNGSRAEGSLITVAFKDAGRKFIDAGRCSHKENFPEWRPPQKPISRPCAVRHPEYTYRERLWPIVRITSWPAPHVNFAGMAKFSKSFLILQDLGTGCHKSSRTRPKGSILQRRNLKLGTIRASPPPLTPLLFRASGYTASAEGPEGVSFP